MQERQSGSEYTHAVSRSIRSLYKDYIRANISDLKFEELKPRWNLLASEYPTFGDQIVQIGKNIDLSMGAEIILPTIRQTFNTLFIADSFRVTPLTAPFLSDIAIGNIVQQYGNINFRLLWMMAEGQRMQALLRRRFGVRITFFNAAQEALEGNLIKTTHPNIGD